MLLRWALISATLVPSSSPAQSPPDKSGVKPGFISLPSGAGSIEGLGESFEPQLNTGSSTYGVGIAVPPGRGGLAPSLRVGYDSQGGNGICGIGWTFELPSIKRQADKGFPEYNQTDTFVSQGEELVPLSNPEQDWRCENERSFERFRRIDTDTDGSPDAWERTDRDGTRHTFGRFRGEGGRWSAVEHPDKGALGKWERTFCWMLDTTTDLHGNRIEYEYTLGTGVLYPSRISYSQLASASHEVLFQYEPRPDALDDYRPTFSARLDRRLQRIEVRSQGQLVRAYNFAYAYEAGDLTPDVAAVQAGYLDLGVTLLKRVVQTDRSGSDSNHLPPLVFLCSGLDLGLAELRSLANTPDLDLAEPNGRVQVVDVDGDALPDLLSTALEGAATVQRVCLNRGESEVAGSPKVAFAPVRLALATSPVDLAQTNTVVHDPRGKGLVDLSSLVADGPNKRLETFGNRARLDWVSEDRLGFSAENLVATTLINPPGFVTYGSAATRQSDINFDKRPDFLNLEPAAGLMKANSYYIKRDGTWGVAESMLPPSYPITSTFALPDGQPNPCVQLADMNGDRMLDLVCLQLDTSGGGQRIAVAYWPLCGLGQYAGKRVMTNSAGDSFDIGSIDLRDVFVEDITGDGLADVAVLDGSGNASALALRVNIGGHRWSAPYVRTSLPRYAPRDPVNPTVLRFADLNANGSVDLLFRNTSPQSTWDYVELLPDGKPSLLTGIDNSIGKRTTIVYGSAAEDEQWAREAGHPWRTHAPIALQVVRQILTTCGQDLNGDGLEDAAVSEFRYRDPYYDGFEREFRGFAFAQRIDYGDDFLLDPVTGLLQESSGWDRARTPTGQVSGPSLVTRYRFHTGASDQLDNDDYTGNLPAFRLVDEVTETGGREEEPLKGLQSVDEKVDPVVLHSAPNGGFDEGCEAASLASAPEAQGRLTPDAYVYTRTRQDWTVRRLYRPAEPLPYFADQDADGILEDYRAAPVAPIPQGRFASQGITVVPGNGRSVSFAYATNSMTEIHEANGLLAAALGYPPRAAVRTVRVFDYDDYGNQTTLRDLGVDGAGFDDERVTITSFAHGGNALALWVIDKPDTISTTDENGVFVAQKRHYYDGAPFLGLAGQIQNRALLSRVEEFTDAAHAVQAMRRQFDAYGNVVETRDPVGNVRRVAWDPVFQSLPISETIVIGGGAPDLVATAAYDYGLAVVTNSTDFNANPTAYHHDSFGRLVKIVRPGDSLSQPTVAFEYQPGDAVRGKLFVYDFSGNLTLASAPLGVASRVITRQREVPGQPGEFITATYSDGCGKALATVEEGEIPNTWIVKKATSYNLRFKPKAQWHPYQISSVDLPHFPALWPAGRPPLADSQSPAVVSIDSSLDPVGREMRSVLPPETWGGVRRETATHYLPLEKRLYDEEDLRAGSSHYGTPHVQHSDGLSRLIAVEEIVRLTDTGETGPLTSWRTEYAYDLNDQLVRIRDSQGNLKTMAFDGLKRMTHMNDPDRGHMSFLYDDASNLRETLDAKGQRIVYTYDGANRIKTEDYRDGGPQVFDVEYFYDLAQPGLDLGDGTTGIAANTRGQIARVKDLSGETHFSYDSRGRVAWEVKRIPDRVHGQLVSFRTGYTYDSADRLDVLTYPDGDQVTHRHNARSLLDRISGTTLGDVIAGTSYRPSGQLLQIRCGNGVQTSYAYDPRLRLTDLVTTNSSGSRLIDFGYTFDAASNIERIEDRRNLTGLPDAAKRFNTQVFAYDSVYRLTRVSYPLLGGGGGNHVAYRYDRIGNMLAQTSDLTQQENGLPVANLGAMDSGGAAGRFNRNGRNPGEPPGPHALTRITGTTVRNYTYDANGNMTVIDGLTNTWDFKDRLVRVESTNMVAEYTYDYTDRRVTKTVHWKNPGPEKGTQVSPFNPAWRVSATHYINRYFEVREQDASVKYVWNGQTRVARVTASFGSPARVQRLRLAQGWNNVCLAVGGQFPVLAATVNPDIAACAYWSDSAPGNGWVEVTAGTTIPAGATLWIYARRQQTLVLSGTPASAGLPALSGASQFVGNTLAEPLDVPATFPASAWMARFDGSSQLWRHWLPGGTILTQLNSPPQVLLPGDSVWMKGALPGPLATNMLPLQVRYYHQDHLGSTAVITENNGLLVEEAANFAYGSTRNSYKTVAPGEVYAFTQKERDAETGVSYFEARFLMTVSGRFTGPDPVHRSPEHLLTLLQDPQNLNPYSYTRGRPLACKDDSGKIANFIIGAIASAAVDAGAQVATAMIKGQDLTTAVQNINLKQVALSAALGAATSGGASVTGAKAIAQALATKIVEKAVPKVATEGLGWAAQKTATALGASDRDAKAIGQLTKTAATFLWDVRKGIRKDDAGEVAFEVSALAASAKATLNLKKAADDYGAEASEAPLGSMPKDAPTNHGSSAGGSKEALEGIPD